MKKKSISFKLLIVALVMSQTPFFAPAQDTLRKQVKHVFKAEPSSTLKINNKYGKIQILSWCNDSVKFEINLAFYSADTAYARKIIENVSFDFQQENNALTAKTMFDKIRSNFIERIKTMTSNTFNPKESDIQIDYRVSVPNYMNLEIQNKYGDVLVGDVVSPFRLELANGNFKAGKLSGESHIDLEFGSGSLEALNNATVKLLYVPLFELKKGNHVDLNSKSSRIEIEEMKVLKLFSKRDTLKIKSIEHVYGESNLSTILIDKLLKEATIESKFGEMIFKQIERRFSFINITSSYTKLGFAFRRSTPFLIDIWHKDATLNYPEKLMQLQTNDLPQEGAQKTTGQTGKAEKPAKLRLKATNGEINLTFR